MYVHDVMTSEPTACVPTDSAQQAALIMKDKDVGMVPIVASPYTRKLAGVITDRDLCMRVVATGENPGNVLLSECMTPNPIACRVNDDLQSVVHKMKQHQIRRIPVVDEDGRLTGIVSMADIALLADLSASEIDETLREISEPTHREPDAFAGMSHPSTMKPEEEQKMRDEVMRAESDPYPDIRGVEWT